MREPVFRTVGIKMTVAVLSDFLWTVDRKKIDSGAVLQLVRVD